MISKKMVKKFSITKKAEKSYKFMNQLKKPN